LLPAELAGHTVESLYAEQGPARPWIYWCLLLGVVGGLASLPLIKVDVSVRAPGIVRPLRERMELRPAISGNIVRVLARDNDRVAAGQALLELATGDFEARLQRNLALQAEHEALKADLEMLTATPVTDGQTVERIFRTPLLHQEYVHHRAERDAYRLAEEKARNELARYATLAGKGIATQQELDNARYEADRLNAQSRLLQEQARFRWQTRRRETATALAGLVSEELRLRAEQTHYTVRSPATGALLGFAGWSEGGYVSAGQSLGAISPDDALVVETRVSPRDIGLLRTGQAVRLQIDAFPYTQWGTLDGVVEAISGDLVAASGEKTSGFKALVRPRYLYLTLPNGLRAELRKGLTLTARFLVARRSLLEILYEDASAWLNPQGNRTFQ
jgi:multidrug resistance efflux pump